MKIHIVTPLSRMENLKKVGYSIVENAREAGIPFPYLKGRFLSVQWHIVMDHSISGYYNTVVEYARELMASSGITMNVYQNYASKERRVAGHSARNLALDFIDNSSSEDGWFYSLDDDNIIHPGLFPYIASRVIDDPYNMPPLTAWSFDGLIFSQINKDGTVRIKADRNCVCPGCIDTAMFMFRIGAVKGLRFKEVYAGDGHFIEELYKRTNFDVVDIPLCYYNYLR